MGTVHDLAAEKASKGGSVSFRDDVERGSVVIKQGAYETFGHAAELDPIQPIVHRSSSQCRAVSNRTKYRHWIDQRTSD